MRERKSMRPGNVALGDASLAAAVALLLYLNTVPNALVFDDHRAIEQNPCVRLDGGEISSMLKSEYWWQLLTTDFWGTPLTSPRSHRSYRPLAVLSLRLDALLVASISKPYAMVSVSNSAALTHAFNAILHSVTTWMLWWHARDGLQGRAASLFAALLFAAHPVNTEAVAYGVGRADLLAGALGLAGMRLHALSMARHRRSGSGRRSRRGGFGPSSPHGAFEGLAEGMQRGSGVPLGLARTLQLFYRISASILLLLALAAKETAVVLLLACACADVLQALAAVRVHKRPTPSPAPAAPTSPASEAARVLPQPLERGTMLTPPFLLSWLAGWSHLLLLGGSFVWLRLAIVGPIGGNFRRLDNPLPFAPNRTTRWLSSARVQLHGLSLLVWPVTLSADYSYDALPLVSDWWHPAPVAALGLYIFVAIIAASLLAAAARSEASRRSRQFAAKRLSWLCLLALSYAPASHALLPLSFVVAERLLYMPCAAACLLVAAALHPPYQSRRQRQQQQPPPEQDRPCRLDWRRGRHRAALFARRVVACVVLVSMGARTMVRTLDWRDDTYLFASAAEAYPRSAKALYQLADGLVKRGNVAEALPMLRRVLDIEPTYHCAYRASHRMCSAQLAQCVASCVA